MWKTKLFGADIDQTTTTGMLNQTNAPSFSMASGTTLLPPGAWTTSPQLLGSYGLSRPTQTPEELKRQVSEKRKRLEAELVQAVQFEAWLQEHPLNESVIAELRNYLL